MSPYYCDFDTKYLRIYATVRITDRSGRRYETITPAAKNNAINVIETNLTWRWTKEPPDYDNFRPFAPHASRRSPKSRF